MKKAQYKTNIKCGACINAVTPYLDKTVGAGQWEVDLESADRLLTVQTDDLNKVMEALTEAGYKGTMVES